MGRVFFNTRDNVHAITGAYTVLPSDSGKVFTVSQASAYTITLPTTDVEGFNVKFICTVIGSNDVKIDGGASNAIKGWASDITTAINAVDNNMVKFVSGAAAVGDVIMLHNDGTSYLCEAHNGGTNGILGADS